MFEAPLQVYPTHLLQVSTPQACPNLPHLQAPQSHEFGITTHSPLIKIQVPWPSNMFHLNIYQPQVQSQTHYQICLSMIWWLGKMGCTVIMRLLPSLSQHCSCKRMHDSCHTHQLKNKILVRRGLNLSVRRRPVNLPQHFYSNQF